jgi:hypothetical protein
MGMAKNDWEVLQFTITTGAASATNFTVTGITTADKVQKIMNLTDLADVDPAGLVISADNIKVTATTSAKKLLVVWAKRSAG